MNDVLFPGCTVQSRLPFIESAFRFILKRLGKDMDDLDGRTCCMEPVGLRSLSQTAWMTINARMHSLAGGRRMVTLCEGCNLSLSEAAEALSTEAGKDVIRSISKFGHDPVISPVAGTLQFLYDNIQDIKENIVRPIDMKAAMFPGCHAEFVCRKKGENAMRMMGSIVNALGSEALRPSDDLCCGGGVSMIDAELDKSILEETVTSFRDMGSDIVVTACPFCFMRFDMVARFPVYHLAEIVAVAMGYDDTMRYHTSKQSQ